MSIIIYNEEQEKKRPHNAPVLVDTRVPELTMVRSQHHAPVQAVYLSGAK
jgi:hypothetical protein